jgi:hypothetical protein
VIIAAVSTSEPCTADGIASGDPGQNGKSSRDAQELVTGLFGKH